MQKIYAPKKEDWKAILQRPTLAVDDIETTVNGIFQEINEAGDSAVKKFTKLFDKVVLNKVQVTSFEIEEATAKVSDCLLYTSPSPRD